MTSDRHNDYLTGLLGELCKLPRETEWVEFKLNEAEPQAIGEYISVRDRFGIAEKNASVASRLLNEAVEAGLIVVEDPEAGTRIRSYLPFWAAPGRDREEVA